MNITASDIAGMVFRRITKDDLGEFSLDARMLKVLMELNGEKNCATVARNTGLSFKELREVISKLQDMNLIESVESSVDYLDQDFLKYLHDQLALAIGPIAEVIIEDAAASLDCNLSKFPVYRAAELVDTVAREITRPEKKAQFQQNMLKLIKEKSL